MTNKDGKVSVTINLSEDKIDQLKKEANQLDIRLCDYLKIKIFGK